MRWWEHWYALIPGCIVLMLALQAIFGTWDSSLGAALGGAGVGAGVSLGGHIRRRRHAP
jgi:hypothetical protein